MVKVTVTKMEREKQDNDTELGEEFNRHIAGVELDRATVDDFLIEHPGASEKATKRALRRIKREETSKKKPSQKNA